VSFHGKDGEVSALLGPTGAGTPPMLRMILGLLRPTAGEARIAGFSWRSEPDEVKRRVGLVSATAGLYPWLSVRELLLYFADLYGVPPVEANEQLARLVPLLGLTGLLGRRCTTLSTGQQQRLQLR